MTQMPWTPAVTESSRLRNYWSAWSSRRGRREPESTAAAVPEPKLKIKQSAFKLWRGRTHWKYSVCIRDKSQGPSSGVPTPQQYINRAEKDVELHHFGHMPVCLLHPPSLMSNSVWSHFWLLKGFLTMGLGCDMSYELWDGLASVTETSFQYAVSHIGIGGNSVLFSSPLIFCGGKLACPWSLHWICSFSFNQTLTSCSPTEF